MWPIILLLAGFAAFLWGWRSEKDADLATLIFPIILMAAGGVMIIVGTVWGLLT